jgi:hypothetical protein
LDVTGTISSQKLSLIDESLDMVTETVIAYLVDSIPPAQKKLTVLLGKSALMPTIVISEVATPFKLAITPI